MIDTQKPSFYRGLRSQKNTSTITIVAEDPKLGKCLKRGWDKACTTCEIALLIQQQRLTDCLIFLEQKGFTGDGALLVLAYVQGGAA